MSNIRGSSRVARAIANTPKQQVLAWIFQHAFNGNFRGPHWGSEPGTGYYRTVNEVLLALASRRWRQVNTDGDVSLLRATLLGATQGIIPLSDLPPTAKVWIEKIPEKGHSVRLPFGGEMIDVNLGAGPGKRALVWSQDGIDRTVFLNSLDIISVELRRGADGKEVVQALYPGRENITELPLASRYALGEGLQTVLKAQRAGFRYALATHELVDGKSRRTSAEIEANAARVRKELKAARTKQRTHV